MKITQLTFLFENINTNLLQPVDILNHGCICFDSYKNVITEKYQKILTYLACNNIWYQYTAGYMHTFGYAARDNQLEVCKWLHATRDISYINPSLTTGVFPYHWAAEGGHLEVCKWLHYTFKFTKEFVTSLDSAIFIFAVRSGNLDLCKWLYSTYNLEAGDVLYAKWDEDDALYNAAAYGHLELCKWLHSTFNITREYITLKTNATFRCAVKNGHLEVCEWLYTTYNLDRTYIISHKIDIIIYAAKYGRLKVLKWLYTTFKLKSEDIDSDAFIVARNEGHKEVCNWLNEVMLLPILD